jgi:hypothetical protein
MSENDWLMLLLFVLIVLNLVLHGIERRSLKREIVRLKQRLGWRNE